MEEMNKLGSLDQQDMLKDTLGMRPLHKAVIAQHMGAVKLLTEWKPDLNTIDHVGPHIQLHNMHMTQKPVLYGSAREDSSALCGSLWRQRCL